MSLRMIEWAARSVPARGGRVRRTFSGFVLPRSLSGALLRRGLQRCRWRGLSFSENAREDGTATSARSVPSAREAASLPPPASITACWARGQRLGEKEDDRSSQLSGWPVRQQRRLSGPAERGIGEGAGSDNVAAVRSDIYLPGEGPAGA